MEQIVRTSEQLGSFIQRRRRQLAMSQQQLADKIGMRQPTISELETSARQTRTGTLLSTLAALDLELVIRPRTKSSAKDIEAIF
jgi:HTH-type transcriptional regulator/antitoxin HipB